MSHVPGDVVSVFDAKRFRAVRRKLRISLADVGEVAQVSRQAVHQWESGRALPCVANVLMICRAWPAFRVAMDAQRLTLKGE